MNRGMIIGRLRPGATKERIAQAFQSSDVTDLPRLIGVCKRSVFILGDVYVHLVEADMPIQDVLQTMKDHPLFVDVKHNLDQCVAPLTPELDPGIAEEIYFWSSEQQVTE